MTALAGVVLAAGAGTRLRPLTDQLPKALVPVGTVPLLDGALARLAPLAGTGPEHLAVNAHAHADLLAAAVAAGDAAAARAHLSREDVDVDGRHDPAAPALGTAGALGALRAWLAGRDVLLTNADAWSPAPAAGDPPALAALLKGWDGERCRLLCEPAPPGARADFASPAGDPLRYVGSCLLPGALVAPLAPVPSGLWEALWRDLAPVGGLDLVVADPGTVDRGTVDCGTVDCGTVADYLRANLRATGGSSAVSPGAVVRGRVERCVVWPGAVVQAGEHLVEVVRAGTASAPVTVAVGGTP